MDPPGKFSSSLSFVETIKALNPDGLLAVDRQLRYTMWDKGMERVAGVNAAYVMGHPALELFPFLKAQGEERRVAEWFQGGSGVTRNLSFHIAESGKCGFFDQVWGPIVSEDDEVVGAVYMIHNVTGRVVQEQLFEKECTVDQDDYLSEESLNVPRQMLKAMGVAISKRRRLMEMSQEELAARSGLHRTYISDIERGIRNVAMCNFVRLARALRIESWVLLAWAELQMQEERRELGTD